MPESRPLERPTSCTAEPIWPLRMMAWMKAFGSMPYCWAMEARKLKTSPWETLTSMVSASTSSTIWSRSSFSTVSSASAFCSLVALDGSAVTFLSCCSTISALTPFGTGISRPSSSLAMNASRAAVA